MNDTARFVAQDRMWNLALAALAAAVAVSTVTLAQTPQPTTQIVPTVGMVEIDDGADGTVDEVMMVRVEGFEAARPGPVVAQKD